MKKIEEQRVQDFLDSEVLKGDEEKVLYLKLYDKIKTNMSRKTFSDVLAFRFWERDCREDYDSLGFGCLSDVVEQSEIIRCFYDVCRDCLLYTSPSPRDATLSRMPSSA